MSIDRRRAWRMAAGFTAAGLLLATLSAPGRATDSQAGNQPPAAAVVVDDAAISNESSGDNWLAYGRTYSEQRFSPLTQITDATVSRLKPDWILRAARRSRPRLDAAGREWRAVFRRQHERRSRG